MFYLISKFHDNRVNTFWISGPGTPKKPRRNRVKDILRTFEAEILKIFKNISASAQKLEVLIENEAYNRKRLCVLSF